MNLLAGVLLVTGFLGLYQLLVEDVLPQIENGFQDDVTSAPPPPATPHPTTPPPSPIVEVFCADIHKVVTTYENKTKRFKPCPSNSPFCDPVTVTCKSDFIKCPSKNGLYPDPREAKSFFVCTDGLAIPFTCALGHIYDPLLKTCKAGLYWACVGNWNKKTAILMDGRSRLFYYCGDYTPVAVSECQEGYYFSKKAKECLPDCGGIGKIPNVHDLSGYTECQASQDGKIVGKYRSCKEGYFDVIQGKCSMMDRNGTKRRLKRFRDPMETIFVAS